jgi:hypothetical protein
MSKNANDKKLTISAAKPSRFRNEGPLVFLLAKRQELLGGKIKVGAGGVLRLEGVSEIGHNEVVGGDPLAYYHHARIITEAQRQAGERYASLNWNLYGKYLKAPSIYDRMVVSEIDEPRKFVPVGIPCGTYCGEHCDCPAKDWMENAKAYTEADNILRRTCRPMTRLVLRRVCIQSEWPERWIDVVRLRYGLGRLVVHWKM